MADKKLNFALLTRFKKLLVERGYRDNINMFSQQWAASALIDSFGYQTCLDVMDYYFSLNNGKAPDWTWFSYNMDKLLDAKNLVEDDKRNREIAKKQAKEWLEK